MITQGIEDKAAVVADLLKHNLGARGPDLAARLKSAGRRLPRRIRREAAVLVEAERHLQSPRLMKRLDPARLEAAFQSCLQHLESVDASERRKGLALNILGGLALSAIGVFALLVTVLVWRGYM